MNNKNLIIGGVVVAGLVAYYLYNKNKSNGGGISAPTGTNSNNVENARAPIGGDSPIFVAPKVKTEEIATASVTSARPIDFIVSPIVEKYSGGRSNYENSPIFIGGAGLNLRPDDFNFKPSNEQIAKDMHKQAVDAFLGKTNQTSSSNPFLKAQSNYGR